MYLSGRVLFQAGLLLALLISVLSVGAQVRPEQYGLAAFSPAEAQAVKQGAAASMDSLFRVHPGISKKEVISALAHPRYFRDQTADFYLLLCLIILLGLIRLTDPRYFQGLWQAFRSPAQGGRQLKDKLQSASFPNLLMNVFFTMSAAAYVFYVVENFTPQRSGNIPPSLLLLMLMAGMMAIYAGKYAVIRFSGWAFRVEGITEHYLFNVFLVNKFMGVVLLPFIVLLAFGEPAIAEPALIVSFLIILILFINRYLRSWQVFGSFFQYSRFHFFMYLCASELLPLAVLMKLLVRGLLY